jgi:hypothetical protein
MNHCDWVGCAAEGIFDGVRWSMLNKLALENVDLSEATLRFVYLCRGHFVIAVGAA